MEQLAIKLSNLDELESWNSHSNGFDLQTKKAAYQIAETLWLKRIATNEKLFMHPKVLEQLETQSWKPNGLQKRMIWASYLGSDESQQSKKRLKKS